MSIWYRATSRRATFGFEVERGRVVDCAPYGRRWLMGLGECEARTALRKAGFTVTEFARTVDELTK